MPEAYDYSGVNWPVVEAKRDVNYSENPHTWSGDPTISGVKGWQTFDMSNYRMHPITPRDMGPVEITSPSYYNYLYPEDELLPNPDYKHGTSGNRSVLLAPFDPWEKTHVYNKAAGYSHADRLQRFKGLRIPPAQYLKNKIYDPYPVKKDKGIATLMAEKIPTPNEIMSLYPHGIVASILMRIFHGDRSNEL